MATATIQLSTRIRGAWAFNVATAVMLVPICPLSWRIVLTNRILSLVRYEYRAGRGMPPRVWLAQRIMGNTVRWGGWQWGHPLGITVEQVLKGTSDNHYAPTPPTPQQREGDR